MNLGLQAPTRYVPALTGIRGIAALLVLGIHGVPLGFIGYPGPLTIFARGYLGVDFFFLLSGFIITHVYLAPLAKPSWSASKVFLWHRIVRIYPVHITVLAGLLAAVALVSIEVRPVHTAALWRPGDVLWHVLLLHAWGLAESVGWNQPSWSISAEWFAYLLFPLIAPLLQKIGSATMGYVLAAAALLATFWIFRSQDWGIADSWVGAPALVRVEGEFICGAALSRAVSLSQGWRLSRHADWLGAGAFALFVLGASTAIPDFPLITLLALTILGAAAATGPFASAVGSAPMVWLGEISYSLYMTHFVVFSIVEHPALGLGIPTWSWGGRMVALAITIAICLAAAVAMFQLVERPMRTRLRNYAGWLAPAKTA
jgi:peptidoglycan/LPS O-acetylase OafA/YrhL